DINLGRDVAVKVFWPRPGETKDFLRRFSREARVLAQLDHPNILPVYDYGEQDGQAYLVMPYMSGGSLKDMLKVRHLLPPAEQINGQPTFASDIYSIGIVLYEMLTGVKPFASNSVMGVLMKQLSEQPRPPREINPAISPQLQMAVLRAIEKDPARRFQRPIDFLQALKQAEISGGASGVVTSMPTIPTNWIRTVAKNIEFPTSTQHAMYSAIDDATM